MIELKGILRSNIEYGCELINEKNIDLVLKVYEYVFEFSYLTDTHRLSSLVNSLVGFKVLMYFIKIFLM